MSSGTFELLLDRASISRGIDPGFWDIWGKYHTAPPETKQAILRAMGVPCGTLEELEQSLAEQGRRDWERLLPPAIVTGESDAIELPLNVPADRLGGSARITLRREDGVVQQFERTLLDLEHVGSAEMDGRTWVRKRVVLPVRLPLGYHDISASAAGARGQMRYIVTPERAYMDPHLGRGGRAAGVSISLYGVRSRRNWGCGDFRDLLDVIDWAADGLDAAFVGLNPLHAIHNRRPFNTSPYLPNCSFYQNFIYLDLESIEEYPLCRRAQALRQSPGAASEIEALRASPFVEYERVAALKMRFLKLCFARFLREWRTGSARAKEFNAFVESEGALLEKYATYCALDDYLHRRDRDVWMWTQWPAPYQDPDSQATKAFRAKHWRAVMLTQYIQWQIDLQLRRAQQHARNRQRSIGLYHDLALATDRFGSDLWGNRSFYVAGARVGSPPDDFSPKGQDWAFPPPNSDRHHEDGYRLFAESIRRNARHGGALRMDHVMRLFRLYWIPEGSDAAHGSYVRECTEDFVKVLALESVRNQVVVVGEDLGTVEPAVRETLARFGILSYRLFYFEKYPDGEFKRFSEYPRQALVSSTTHDLPTLAGFWIGADLHARRDAGVIDEDAFHRQTEERQVEKQKMLDALFELNLMPSSHPRQASAYPELTGDLHNAVVGFLASAPSQLLAINQEDLTKETAQQNLPGTTWQYPNWGRKMRYSVEELRSNPEARGYTAMFHNWIERTGRSNRPLQSVE
jgi:4-alpha-glucanotransferase